MTKQTQKGGNQSTNIQAETVTISHGVSYDEARSIALDVFQNNFMKLSEKAYEIARRRAEEITEKFLSNLQENNERGIERAEDPDLQHALFNVQKDFARIGDRELGDLLVDLLVDRTKQNNRSILQIVLNEALLVAPKLTKDQLATLSVIFIFRNCLLKNMGTIELFGKFLDDFLSPFIEVLTKNSPCYQHLEFTGCGSISVGSTSIQKILRSQYSGLFSKGFTQDDIQKRNILTPNDSPIFIKCLHDDSKLQMNAISEDNLRTIATSLKIEEEEVNKLLGLHKNFVMSEQEIKDFLIEFRPYMRKVFDVWEGSFMKNLSLTSVGIAIAHANIKRQIGEFTDLSIWIY